MLQSYYNELDDAYKLIYTEVASNPALKLILTKEQENLHEQILGLHKKVEETNEEFVLRHTRLKEQLSVIENLLEINAEHIKSIQQQ